MRLGLLQISHETNPLCPGETGVADFARNCWRDGPEMLGYFAGTASYMAGAIAAAQAGGCDLVPLFAAKATPSGPIAQAAVDEIRARVTQALAEAGKLDGLYVELHGAACSAAEPDLEGAFLGMLREILGAALPIAASLDLHANVSARMCAALDVLTLIKAYPHTDMWQAGHRAVALLTERMRGTRAMTLLHRPLPLLMPLTRTDDGPGAEILRRLTAGETRPGVLSLGLAHGFPYAEGPDTGATLVAMIERDHPEAAGFVDALAAEIWALRAELAPTALPPAAALAAAAAHLDARPAGLVVLSEGADNPGAGCPQDGTHLLRAMLEADLPGSVFCYLCDPETVAEAHRLGPGGPARLRLGGGSHPLQGGPLEADWAITALRHLTLRQSGPMFTGEPIALGRSAVLRHGNVHVIIAEGRSQPLNGDIARAHGLMPGLRVIALKSAIHFRAWWTAEATLITDVSTPGLAPLDLRLIGFTGENLKKYPFKDVAFGL